MCAERPRFRAAAQEAGFLVISNLALETRPCYKRVKPRELPELAEDKIQASRVTSTTPAFATVGGCQGLPLT